MTMHRLSVVLLSAMLLATACSDSDSGAAKQAAPAFPEFTDARLQQGRAIWLETCKACHGYGLAGAPRITDQAAWQPRIARGKATLYEHALNGFLGPAGTEMPARGGNDALTDSQVKAAVDYMVAASQ